MLAPEPAGGRDGYALFIQPGAGEGIPPGLAPALDHALAANPHYRYCRDLGQLAPVRVCVMRRNGYAAYVAECRRRGQRLGDVKASPLSRHAGWAAVFARARCRVRWIPDAAPVHSAATETR
jgi:hypothetical protein